MHNNIACSAASVSYTFCACANSNNVSAANGPAPVRMQLQASCCGMGDGECYEPSSLITSIHRNVPFLTDAGSVDKSADLVLDLGDGTRAFYDYFVVSSTPAVLCKL